MRRMKYRSNRSLSFSIWSFIFGLMLVVIFAAFTISVWYIQSETLSIIFLILGLIIIILTDDSGIRDWLFDLLRFSRRYSWSTSKYDQLSELYKTLSYIGLLLTWLFPRIRVITLVIVILFPLFSVIRSFRYRGRACFGAEDRKELSPTAWTLLMTGLIMTVWTMSNQQYNYLIWLESGAFALIWIILFFIFNKEYKDRFTVALGFIVCIAIFSFGAIGNINRVYDFHPIQQYNETVINKNMTGGKSRTFYIYVTPWSGGNESQEIEVDFSTYKDVQVGQTVTIEIYKGALGFSWLDVVSKN